MQEIWYEYKIINDKEIRLLRVYGQTPCITIPGKIAGKKVTQIGAYCFAAKKVEEISSFANEEKEITKEEFLLLLEKDSFREVAGDYVEGIILPESVISIGTLAFYQCSHLKTICVGRKLFDVGSDAFMNCHELSHITVYGSIFQESGLKAILAQRSQDTRVEFVTNQTVEAVLWYAEYSEYYDEIGPAHIFELCIDGDGFRARQCFKDGRVDIAKYDEVFVVAKQREKKDILVKTAFMRLYYPAGLSQKAKEHYEQYLVEEISYLGDLLVKEQKIEEITFLVKQKYMAQDVLLQCIQKATKSGWTEGVGALLRLKNMYMEEKEERYAFDDF